MKYLIFIPHVEDEVSYNLSEIVNIVNDYAQNILDESVMHENNLKPLEMVTVISLKDGKNKIYRTAESEVYFD